MAVLNLSGMQVWRKKIRDEMKIKNILQEHNRLWNQVLKKIFAGVFVIAACMFLWWIWGRYDTNYWKSVGEVMI